ncbi:hypothetical protein Scep_014550 [Stephania cephalantha]|uniref:Uncharacterized protein n=1 Tax=Stephania cephalantha TaxID=152367 RepID=A0AAP0J1G1_9MAGN
MRAMQCSGEDVQESNQASLCWDCDSKVHCANFLAARHSTILLCLRANPQLGPTTVSVCERCMKGKARGGRVAEEESHDGNEIEALHESTMPFVPVHRGEAQADGDVGVQAVYKGEGQRRRSRGGGEPRRLGLSVRKRSWSARRVNEVHDRNQERKGCEAGVLEIGGELHQKANYTYFKTALHEQRTIADIERDMISDWLSQSTTQQPLQENMQHMSPRLQNSETQVTTILEHLMDWKELSPQSIYDSYETMNAATSKSVESDEFSIVDEYLSEPKETLEVSSHEPDITIA